MAIDFSDITAAITATGALGVAAFGVAEALGKALVVAIDRRGRGHFYGLPYVGFEIVKNMMTPLAPALQTTYGEGYLDIIASQYRADRGDGKAPDTIRQGVRLALPFMTPAKASELIGKIWDMDKSLADKLAQAVQPSATPADAQAGADLAGRFATALDVRISAAFSRADERYQAVMRLVAGIAAVAMALLFTLLGDKAKAPSIGMALLIGLAAVPLAPIVKDLTTSLQSAFTAFKSVPKLKV